MRTIVQPKSDTPPSQAAFIDKKQMLARLPVSRRTLFNWRTAGKIPRADASERFFDF
jgi:predicted DNA-binding transcriptional regulator AlpA